MKELSGKAQAGEDYWQTWFDERLARSREHLAKLVDREDEAAAHVHEARRNLKRLRAATRVLEGMADSDRLAQDRRLFRKAGRHLAGSRDGTIRLRTFEGLAGKAKGERSEVLTEVRAALEEEAAIGEEHAGDGAKEALRLLGGAGLPDAPWHEDAPKPVRRNLVRLAKRMRREIRDLQKGQRKELHELRKRAKDLLYGLQSLPGKPGSEGTAILDRLALLQENLGLHHDVEVLEEWLRASGYDSDRCPGVWKAAKRTRKKLRKAVLKDGAGLRRVAWRKSIEAMLRDCGGRRAGKKKRAEKAAPARLSAAA